MIDQEIIDLYNKEKKIFERAVANKHALGDFMSLEDFISAYGYGIEDEIPGIEKAENGGPNSGFHGHVGIPGQRGGGAHSSDVKGFDYDWDKGDLKTGFKKFTSQKKIRISEEDLDYIKENVHPEIVKGIVREIEKAEAEGLKTSILDIKILDEDPFERNINASCGKTGRRIELSFIKKHISKTPEQLKEEVTRLGESGKKWWTGKISDAITKTTRHELGHALNYMTAVGKGPYVNIRTQANKIINNAKKEFIGLDLSQRINAKKTSEQAEKAKILEENKGFSLMSQYGTTNTLEMIAESYSNPQYSEFTKLIYKHLKKELSNGK